MAVSIKVKIDEGEIKAITEQAAAEQLNVLAPGLSDSLQVESHALTSDPESGTITDVINYIEKDEADIARKR